MKNKTTYRIEPDKEFNIATINPSFTDENTDKHQAKKEMEKLQKRMDELQFKLYAERKQSLLICLQGPDAAGKDGVIRHVIGSMNPQGCRVASFKQPSAEELSHNFLWRIERQTPGRGEVVIFNRSHYEDVLIVRVHDLVPKKDWMERYEMINDFERRLLANGTHVLKIFLNISKIEQLKRFGQRLEDPARHWKISESDYSEREYWDDYMAAYQDVLGKCSTQDAPWFVIPSDHKWFRNLAISRIIVDTLEYMDMKLPEPTVDIEDIRRKFHKAVEEG